MENGKWKAENGRQATDRRLSGFRNSFSFSENCPACGAAILKETARFCNVCGKLLLEEYEPLDNLRASYNLQGKAFNFSRTIENKPENLFTENKNAASETAWACCVYSMVPYLGILFVPLTFAISSFAYFISLRRPESGGKKLALASFYLSFVIAAIQLFLWWLFYVIPKNPSL